MQRFAGVADGNAEPLQILGSYFPAEPAKRVAETPADEARSSPRDCQDAWARLDHLSASATIVPTRSAFAIRVSVKALAGRFGSTLPSAR